MKLLKAVDVSGNQIASLQGFQSASISSLKINGSSCFDQWL